MAKRWNVRTGWTFALRRTRAIAATAVVVGLWGAGVAPGAESDFIFMRPGSSKTLKVSFPVARLSVQDANVVAASLPSETDKTDVLLTAKAVGTSGVTLQGEGAADAPAVYDVIVLNLLPEDVRDLIKGFPGLEVKGTPVGVIIQGVVFNKKDKDQIDALCAPRAHDIIDLVGYDPVHPLILKRIRQLINMPGVEVSASSDGVVLGGYAPNEDAKKRAEDLAKSLADKVLNVIAVLPQQVELDCVFISADKNWRDRLGVNLLGDAIRLNAAIGTNAPAESSFLKNTSYAITASGGAVVNCLERDIRNKVLCKPHLTVVSGKTAEVDSGGQIGVRFPGAITYIPFGLVMKILPTIDAENHIQSDLQFELSSIPTNSEQGYGDLSSTVFKISTTVRCKSNETIICSGLKDTREDTVDERTPILGYIPLISYLGFRRTLKVKTEREVLVCITPSLAHTVSIPEMYKQGMEDSMKLLQEQQPKE